MSRKLLSLVVALAVVLSSMSFAFAAATSTSIVDGVADANVKAAVGKLFALGMTDGMEDGKFHPEGKLTRAQATTFIVRALGLESAANAAKGATSFTDVAADNWASGYINVAAGQGLVQGMGDGTFAPDSEVTYAQAITMLVRALGYQDSFLKGTWPGNYLAKAADVKVTRNVTITPNGVADRGAVALLLGNTLDSRVVKITKYTDTGIEYGEVKVGTGSNERYVTLLEDKLDIRKFEEFRIIGDYRLGGLKTDELNIVATKTGDSSLGIKKMATGLNYDGIMGAKANVYIDDSGDGKVVYAEKAASTEVLFDSMDKIMDTDERAATPELKTKYTGRTLMFDDASYLYVNADSSTQPLVLNNSGTTGADFTNAIWDSASSGAFNAPLYGKFVIEGNKIVFAELYGGKAAWNNMGGLVKSVDGNKVNYWDKGGNEKTLDISANYAGGAIVRIEGVTSTLADLKPFDVFYIKDCTYDSKLTANMFVVRKSISGKINGYKGTGSDTASVDVGGTTYDLANYNSTLEASFSMDNDATIEAFDGYSVNAAGSDIDDMYGATAKVILDVKKNIRHISTETNVTSAEKYGIVKKVNEESESVKIYTQDGEDVTYSFEDADKIGYLDSLSGTHLTTIANLKTQFSAAGTDSYKYASFKLNKDGKIAKDTLLLKKAANAVTINGKFGKDTFYAGSNIYVDTENVTVIDTEQYNLGATSDPSVSSWDSLSEKDQPSSMTVLYFRKNEVKGNTDKDVTGFFVVTGQASSDAESAYVVSYFYKDGKDYVRVFRYGQTAAEDIELADTTGLPYKESARVVAKTSGNKIDVTSVNSGDDTFGTVGGMVYAINGDKYTIGTSAGTQVYKVESNAVVYQNDALKSLSNIQVGDAIVGLVKNGKIQVIEWAQSDVSSTRAQVATITVVNGTSYTCSIGGWSNISDVKVAYDTRTQSYANNTIKNWATGTYNVLVWKTYDENKLRSVMILP